MEILNCNIQLQKCASIAFSALGQNTFEIIKYAQVIILCI